MAALGPLMDKKTHAVETSRVLIFSDTFRQLYRMTDKAFSRNRCLTFALVVVLILRKSVKSLQLVLNELMVWMNEPPVSASAFSQARYKLQHEAFIELNQKAIVETR